MPALCCQRVVVVVVIAGGLLGPCWQVVSPSAAAAGEDARADDKTPLSDDASGAANSGASHNLSVDGRDVVFAVRKCGQDPHWYANFGYWSSDRKRKLFTEGARLCRLNRRNGQTIVLLDDPKGGIRDPQVHYGGRKILFSYRPGETEHYHLFEIGVDGRGLTQLTDGPFDDIEATYLPDDSIIFCSSRCRRWVKCWSVQVATLYRCDADGRNIRGLTSSDATENTPCVLPDGRILYTRWEYVDRSQVHYHHLWVMNPDGTKQATFFGNMHPGEVMVDAKPIPGTRLVLAIFSPGHGQREHDGAVVVVDPGAGPDAKEFARTIAPQAHFRDPFPVLTDRFLVARGADLLEMNERGESRVLFSLTEADRRLGLQIHEPVVVGARPREPVIPSQVKRSEDSGRLVLANIYEGRNLSGVRPGEIKKLLVIESLPKPINYTGGMDPISYGGSFSLERVAGTVPVEEDGSAYLELPALRSFFFVALDKDDLAVKRMQSFLTVQPGEVTGCVGCHEQRNRTVLPNAPLRALTRPPSRIEPIADAPEVIDFPRDVQPILDKLCVDCHGYARTDRGGPRAGNIILSGDKGPIYSHSYFTLTVKKLFSDGRNDPHSNYAPRTLGSANSRLLSLLNGRHHGVQASDRERKLLRLWIETGATYPGTYAALGTGSIGGYNSNSQVETDFDWKTTREAADVMQRRCDACHEKGRGLPHALADECGVSFWRPDWNDLRLRYSRHIVFNLSHPEHSLVLLAPLTREAGGLQLCQQFDERGQPQSAAAVLTDKNDPDYQKLLAMCAAGKSRLDAIKRFDMPGFRPRADYVREMQRYGVLPAPLATHASLDPYQIDLAYWRALWHTPSARPSNTLPRSDQSVAPKSSANTP